MAAPQTPDIAVDHGALTFAQDQVVILVGGGPK
jgi:hypothetical protein